MIAMAHTFSKTYREQDIFPATGTETGDWKMIIAVTSVVFQSAANTTQGRSKHRLNLQMHCSLSDQTHKRRKRMQMTKISVQSNSPV